MRIQTGDIFLAPAGPQDAICITTNGMVRKDGHAVMGRGIALEANKRFGLSLDLARCLNRDGNHTFDMGVRVDKKTGRQMRIFTFPTKHDWRYDSDITLIKTSAHELTVLVDELNVKTCYLTKPGCANGHLNWETQVRPELECILDDRFVIMDLA